MWRPFNVALHIIWGTLFVVLVQDYHFVDPALYESVRSTEQREVFALAVQLGRLDFLNAVIAILAVVFGVGALFGIVEVRRNAEQKAEEAAVPVAENTAKATVQELLPSMVAREVLANMSALNSLGGEDATGAELNDMMQALAAKDEDNAKQ